MQFLLILCALSFCLAEEYQLQPDYTYFQGANGFLKLHRIPATWQEAYLTCYYEGGVLASPENDYLRGALHDIITNEEGESLLSSCGVFTGIHATFAKGVYFSVEGTPLSRIPVSWAPGEPDNADNNEDCLLMLPNGTLADVNCSDVYPYVCYRKESKMTLNICGPVDNGYTLDQRTGSCYKFHSDPLNWTRAFAACAHEGGHLAVINSKTEHKAIQELYSKSYPHMLPGPYHKDTIFLGYRNFEGHYLWMTIHGQGLEEAGFNQWSEGQPNHYGGPEDCGGLFRDRDGLLNDVDCSRVLPFVCEKPPSSFYKHTLG